MIGEKFDLLANMSYKFNFLNKKDIFLLIYPSKLSKKQRTYILIQELYKIETMKLI